MDYSLAKRTEEKLIELIEKLRKEERITSIERLIAMDFCFDSTVGFSYISEKNNPAGEFLADEDSFVERLKIAYEAMKEEHPTVDKWNLSDVNDMSMEYIGLVYPDIRAEEVEEEKTDTTNVTMLSNGVSVINVTPHPITFADGDDVVSVPTSGIIINAVAKETVVKPATNGRPTFVKVDFVASDEAAMQINAIETSHPGVVIVGSIIAAQAFPGRVFSMTPAPGFERVAPADKRMNIDKFTTF